MSGRRAGQRLGIERLLAVRANDVTLVAGGGLRHVPSVASERLVRPIQERDETLECPASIPFLALDATFSTGTVLCADGGYTAR